MSPASLFQPKLLHAVPKDFPRTAHLESGPCDGQNVLMVEVPVLTFTETDFAPGAVPSGTEYKYVYGGCARYIYEPPDVTPWEQSAAVLITEGLLMNESGLESLWRFGDGDGCGLRRRIAAGLWQAYHRGACRAAGLAEDTPPEVLHDWLEERGLNR